MRNECAMGCGCRGGRPVDPLVRHRTVTAPPGYAERECFLVSCRMPFRRHCFVLCHEPNDPEHPSVDLPVMSFFMAQAHALSARVTGNEHSFVIPCHARMPGRAPGGWVAIGTAVAGALCLPGLPFRAYRSGAPSRLRKAAIRFAAAGAGFPGLYPVRPDDYPRYDDRHDGGFR